MNYCSRCGSSKLVWKIPEGDTKTRTVCTDCNTVHYENPRIVTGCLPLWEGKVLLCRRSIEPQAGLWNVPAGFMENNETVEEGAQREVWEEACANVRISGLLALYSNRRFNHLYIHFLGELIDGQFGVGEESLESRLFAEQDIPWEDLAFHSSEYALRKFFENRKKGTSTVHVGSY